jgi:NAD-dependent DNA ligase
MKVITPAPEAKMPDVEYKWNATHVDVILAETATNPVVVQKTIARFMAGIGVDGLGLGNVKRLMKAGFDSIEDILAMTEDDFLEVDGFKSKMAEKLHDSIQSSVAKVSLERLMAASNIFGRGMGEKRIVSILDQYPDILTSDLSDDAKIANVATISGLGKKTAENFVDNIPLFMLFMKNAGLMKKVLEYADKKTSSKEKKDTSHSLYGKSVVMTGFRDKMLMEKIKEVGGKIGSSVSKNTFVVLVKDLDEDTGKVLKAKDLGIPIMLPDKFADIYGL